MDNQPEFAVALISEPDSRGENLLPDSLLTPGAVAHGYETGLL